MIILQERGKIFMRTWDDYKTYAKSTNQKTKKIIEETEEHAAIISAVIQQRHALGISQRELASLCGIPQSSVARIESFKTTPNLGTLLKLLRPLGLRLTISK